MPVRKAWDHTIELKEGFTPKKGKVYSLSREEREEVQAFVEDQLQKGYIRPSKSPQTLPVHFVVKKDGKRRMVQDYHHINQWMVKNGYPLPLIADILDGVGKRKVFTKLDLRWVLSKGSECLSDHPRWMFKKNSMEFFVGLQSYLYYCYSGCTLKSHDHLLFLECSMVT